MTIISSLRRHLSAITLVVILLGSLAMGQIASANQTFTETVSNGTFTLTVVYDDVGIVSASYTGDCSRLGGSYEVRTLNFTWNWDKDGDFATPRVWCQDTVLKENTQCRLELTIKRPGTPGWGSPTTTPWSTATGCLDCTVTPTNTLPTSTPVIPPTSTQVAHDDLLTPVAGEIATSTPVIPPTNTPVVPTEIPTLTPTEAPKTCPAAKYVLDAGALSTCDESQPAVQIKLDAFYVLDPKSKDGRRYNADGTADLFWDHGDIFKIFPIPSGWSRESVQNAIEAYSTLNGLDTDYLVKAEFNPDTGIVTTKMTWKQFREIFGGGEYSSLSVLVSDRGNPECPEWHVLKIAAHWFPCPAQVDNQTSSTTIPATQVAPTTVAPTTVAPTRVPDRDETPGDASSIELSTLLTIFGFAFVFVASGAGIVWFRRSQAANRKN